jgi:hypothetical protein
MIKLDHVRGKIHWRTVAYRKYYSAGVLKLNSNVSDSNNAYSIKIKTQQEIKFSNLQKSKG